MTVKMARQLVEEHNILLRLLSLKYRYSALYSDPSRNALRALLSYHLCRQANGWKARKKAVWSNFSSCQECITQGRLIDVIWARSSLTVSSVLNLRIP